MKQTAFADLCGRNLTGPFNADEARRLCAVFGSTVNNGYIFDAEEMKYPDSGENGWHLESPTGTLTTGFSLCGGDSSLNTRGACYSGYGVSQATTPGMALMKAADMAGGASDNAIAHARIRAYQTSEVQLQTSGGAQSLNLDPAGGLRYTGSPLSIYADTEDGSDNKYVEMSGGATSSVSRGAVVRAEGNEVASSGGQVTISAGDVSTGDVFINIPNAAGEVRIASGATPLWTFNTTGEAVGGGTATIGWSIVAFDSTDCTTTCTAPCVAGFDAGGSALVSCASADAEQCLCAGAN